MTSKEVKVYLSKQITMCEEKIELYEKVKTSKDFIELHKNLLDFYKTIEKDLDLLEQYKAIEKELGIDLIEAKYVLDNANMTVGYTRDGKPIQTDYGYIEEFIDQLREALKK